MTFLKLGEIFRGVGCLTILIALTSCKSSLDLAKEKAKAEIAQEDKELLKKFHVEELILEMASAGSRKVETDAATVVFPEPKKFEQHDDLAILFYPNFSVTVIRKSEGQLFKNSPSEWGENDLDKMRNACSWSGDLIDRAATVGEVKAAKGKVIARVLLAPNGSFERVAWLTNPQFEGLLAGSFVDSAWMEFHFRPRDQKEKLYFLKFRKNGDVKHGDIVEFLTHIAFSS